MGFGLESPYGTVSPTSPFYIERQADRNCLRYFEQLKAATVFVKGPRQVGKSSLMQRVNYIITQKNSAEVVYIDFETFTSEQLKSLDDFLIAFCYMVSEILKIPNAIDKYWSSRFRSSIKNCSYYFSEHVIPHLNKPLILAMDEVEKLQDAPFRNDFFGMLRAWHNARSHDSNFQKLGLFLSSSTEPQLLIDNLNQSPFNVAQPILLNDFTLNEVYELNQRYAMLLSDNDITALMNLLNGHPFLTHLSFHVIGLQECDLDMLLQPDVVEESPFHEHLSRFWQMISESFELVQALEQICRNRGYPEERIYFRLKGAGLVRRINHKTTMRNKLYEYYFSKRLGI